MVDAQNPATSPDLPATLEEPESSGGAGQAILDLVDKAIGLQASMVRKNIARARQRNPEATPELQTGVAKYFSLRGMNGARRVTGLCVQEQRMVAIAIMNAREVALLPYASTAR